MPATGNQAGAVQENHQQPGKIWLHPGKFPFFCPVKTASSGTAECENAECGEANALRFSRHVAWASAP
jgi:hypothetical protein